MLIDGIDCSCSIRLKMILRGRGPLIVFNLNLSELSQQSSQLCNRFRIDQLLLRTRFVGQPIIFLSPENGVKLPKLEAMLGLVREQSDFEYIPLVFPRFRLWRTGFASARTRTGWTGHKQPTASGLMEGSDYI